MCYGLRLAFIFCIAFLYISNLTFAKEVELMQPPAIMEIDEKCFEGYTGTYYDYPPESWEEVRTLEDLLVYDKPSKKGNVKAIIYKGTNISAKNIKMYAYPYMGITKIDKDFTWEPTKVQLKAGDIIYVIYTRLRNLPVRTYCLAWYKGKLINFDSESIYVPSFERLVGLDAVRDNLPPIDPVAYDKALKERSVAIYGGKYNDTRNKVYILNADIWGYVESGDKKGWVLLDSPEKRYVTGMDL